jgi:hypothetical protein
MLYIQVDRINGRKNLALLMDKFADLGLTEVFYNPGGWGDTDNMSNLPHLMFRDETEAMIYCLKYGGILLKEIPTVVTHDRW